MTPRENLLETLRRGRPERRVWAPLIDEYFAASLTETTGITDPIDAIKHVHGDVLLRHANLVAWRDEKVKVTTSKEPGVWRTSYETPWGLLVHETAPADPRRGAEPVTTKHLITTVEEMKIYKEIIRHREYYLEETRWRKAEEKIGDEGIASPSQPAYTPFTELLLERVGLANIYFLLLDHQAEFEDLLRVLHQGNLEVARIAASSRAEVFMSYEDTSTTTISPEVYRKYVQPCAEEYARILRAQGKIYLLHMCGKLRGLKREIGRTEVDGIDSVSPPPTGDLPVWEAREAWGPEKIIIGGIPANVFVEGDEEQMVAYARNILQRMAGDKRFILSSADATPYGARVESMRAVSALVKGPEGKW